MAGLQPIQGTLILICGLLGAGKTTHAKRLAIERSAVRFCPDEWIEALLADATDVAGRERLRDPVENLQWDLAQGLLSQGFTVILENGFWAEEERSLYAMRALELGARIELTYLSAATEVLWWRIAARNEESETVAFVMSRDELDEAVRVFEAPLDEELAFYDEFSTVQEGSSIP